MPWASHFGAVQLAFAQWAADVSAVVIDRVKRTGNVEESYFFSACFNQAGLTGGNFICGCNFYELWHFDSPELGHENNFTDILSRLEIPVRCGDLIKRKRAINVRLDPTFVNS